MARVLAVTNLKGGVGKSITAINLSAGIAREGVSTLLVDVDLKGRLALWLNREAPLTLAHVIAGSAHVGDAIANVQPNFDLLPSGDGPLQAQLQQLRDPSDAISLFQRALRPVMKRYDVIVLDCGPSGDIFSIAGYAVATEALIVASTDRAGADGLEEQVDYIARLQQAGFKIRITAVIPTMYDARTQECQYWLGVFQKQIAVTTNPIRYDIRLREQPRVARPIWDFAPDSRGADDYTQLVRRILCH